MTPLSAIPTTSRRLLCGATAAAALLLSACDQFNPTGVENPNVTNNAFLRTPDASKIWVKGVERTYLSTINSLMANVEIVSDNYFNNYTTQNKVFDQPRIDNQDLDVRSMFIDLARLRESATYGIDVVLPADTLNRVRNEADLLFYRAMASIWAGEYFAGMPAVALGPIVDGPGHLRLAIDDLKRARTLYTDVALRNACTAALARAYYRLGDRANATTEATALLAAAPSFLRNATFDGITGPSNSFQGLITGSTNNYQPLPRLDFLDPKYPNRGAQVQSPLAVLKAEEAHAILAEAALATSDVTTARTRLRALLTLIQSRPTELVDSRTQNRGRSGGTVIYPDSTDYRVAFSPGAPFQSGFVLYRRGATVRVATVSGTSVTAERIDQITSANDGYYVLYLMRQEMFFAEGRRSTDIGLRFPVPFAEAQVNTNISMSAPYMSGVIPSFLPTNLGMDSFVMSTTARTVEIRNDVNAILVANRTSPLIMPFKN
ncbi:hypothetical protein GAU_3173 [Gemmatimonas aurantiaca T-27]|uniref:Tetratricopeptide repeat protein n=1 Tax=Gemmatimonas aurantiaca (strain DSM 14586 / JCM 11422 / NBRC 100505 / T-27) TaxID=379066 RepID=C1ACI8_GEMAT|nr:hypothetical protein [Gemmatimonas aurantiaca]BAH40215.1 hypothetical protein GAU_3173 [Gemmatimonas aurantiaca T-27]